MVLKVAYYPYLLISHEGMLLKYGIVDREKIRAKLGVFNKIPNNKCKLNTKKWKNYL